MISGAEGWVGIETYGKAKYEWLKEFLELPNGIPSHDTFSRVFSRINPSEFQQGFLSWVNSIRQKLAVEVIAIPALIEMLEIEGSIITIDAMGCQKNITSLIINKQADYLLALKANQKHLYEDVKKWFKLANIEEFTPGEYSYHKSIESGHHRIEKREVWAVPVSSLPSLHNQSLWTGLTTVVMVKSEGRLWNKTTRELRFYLSSLSSNAEKIATAIRSHWGIENSLHWTLDVTFSEDKSRIRKDNAPENFALLRRLAINLLKQETSFKASLKMKRYRAAMDNHYLTNILTSSVK